MWELVFLVMISPFLQFLLIKLNSPRIVYSIVPFSFCFFGPLYFRYPTTPTYAAVVSILLFSYLRICDISILPTAIVRSWTVYDYSEYFMTYYTKEQRKKLGKKCYSKYSTPFSKRDASYYGKVAWKLLVQYVALNLLVWYTNAYPPQDQPFHTIVWPYNLRMMVDNFIFGLICCLLLSISNFFILNYIDYNLVFQPLTHFFQIPFEPIMNSPFLSTSIRDFWSNRWNTSIKLNLHRVGFVPVVEGFRLISGIKNGEKCPSWHSILGAMSKVNISDEPRCICFVWIGT